mgnify:CR=1 FL=1
MPIREYRPRLSIELDPDQFRRLQAIIPWGLQRHVFNEIVNDLIALVEENGEVALGLIISKAIRPRECLRVLNASIAASKE